MGLRQAVSEWFEITKDAFGFGQEFPDAMAARRVEPTQDSAGLQHLLDEAQEACRRKDELIAKLQAARAIKGEMVVDESAYYIKKKNTLDGPFCLSCFQQNHQMTRIEPSPKPVGADESSADWVQCVKCRIPFQSDRASRYLNPTKTDMAETPVSREGSDRPAPVKASPKPRPRTRRPKKSPSEQARSTPARRRRSAKPPSRSSTTSPRTPAKDTASPPTTPESSRSSLPY